MGYDGANGGRSATGPCSREILPMPLRKQLLATTAVLAAVLLAAAACEGTAPTHVPTRTPVVIAIPPTSTPTPVTLTPTLTPTPVAVTATLPPTPVVVTVVVTAPPPPAPVVVVVVVTATTTPPPVVVTATPTPLPTTFVVTATPTPTPDSPRLVFSDVSWNSVQIQNAIVRKIAELGYGYETDAIYGDTIPLFEALVRGDTNITMEIWLPNQREAYEAALASGAIVDLGKSLADNWQSAFIIPRYTKDANPGLVSVEDLRKPEYMELFVTPDSGGKARALGCISGWSCAYVNEEKLVAYGLTDFVSFYDPGSNAALDAEIIAAFERGEDVLFYYWGPTTLTDRLEREYSGYYILEEPEYTDACWAADKGCAYAISEVYIAVRHELIESAPDIVELLRNWDFTGPLFIAAANYLAATDASYDEVAAWWLRNTDEWKEWVAPGVADKVLAGL